MKQSIKWMLGALALVVVIAGASLLYNTLSDDFAPDRLTEVPPADGLQESNTENKQEADSGNQANTEGENQTQGDEQNGETNDASVHEPTAPNFAVLDADGDQHQLSDFFGKPIVINFWASWCGYCVQEMPDFEAAYAEHPEVQFMMINVTDGQRETVENAKAFIEQKGYTFPVYYDTTLVAAMSYGASGLPMSFFIDKNGDVVAYASGMINADTLARGISKITEPAT